MLLASLINFRLQQLPICQSFPKEFSQLARIIREMEKFRGKKVSLYFSEDYVPDLRSSSYLVSPFLRCFHTLSSPYLRIVSRSDFLPEVFASLFQTAGRGVIFKMPEKNRGIVSRALFVNPLFISCYLIPLPSSSFTS